MLLTLIATCLVLSVVKIYIFPIYDMLYSPFYFLIDLIQRFMISVYMALGLLFLIYLLDKEYPGFRLFIESILRKLRILK